MDVPSLHSSIKAANLPFEKIAANPNISDQDKIAEASRQFEAVLLRQMLTEGRKNVLSPDSEQNSSISSIYNDMIDNQLADSISHSGAFGLSKSIEKQLSHQLLGSPAAKSKAAAPASSSIHAANPEKP